MRLRFLSTALFGAVALLLPAVATALMVSGDIVDSATPGMSIAGIKVEVRDSNFPLPSSLIDTVYTDGSGNYSSTLVSAGDDVFVRVKWEFQLIPTSFYGDRFIKLEDRGTGSPFFFSRNFDTVNSSTNSNVTTDIVVDVTMTNSLTGLGTLLQRIQEAMDYYRNNGGAVAWSPSYDIPVHVRDDSPGSFFVNVLFFTNGVFLDLDLFDGTPNSRGPYTIYHEVGHLVHWRFFGSTLLGLPGNGGCHTIHSETRRTNALTEGWPQYVAVLTAGAAGVPASTFDESYRDVMNVFWRGSKQGGLPCVIGPIDSGFDNSGEIVEGALTGFMFDYTDPARANLGTFEDIFRVMHDDQPRHFFDLSDEMVADAGGASTATTLGLYRVAQAHGIFFSRLRFDSPAWADGAGGTARVINDVTHLRGIVEADVQAMSDSELNLSERVTIDQGRIGWRFAPAPGTTEDVDPATLNTVFTFTSPVTSSSFGSVPFDTTMLSGDGPYDVLLQGDNEHGFSDDFNPDWAGDVDAMGNPTSVNTDERYLKTIGAWFDDDMDPTSNPELGGKVVVDNTDPTATITISK